MYQNRTTSIYSLAIVWALLIPTLYFVAKGTFSFDRIDTNNSFVAGAGTISGAWAGGTAYYQIQQAATYMLLCFIMLPLFARCIATLATLRDVRTMLLLPFWALLSILWSQSMEKTLIAACTIILLVCFATYLTKRFDTKRQMLFFQFVGGIALLFSIVLVFCFPEAGIANFSDRGAWQGIFSHKNHCAVVMTYLIVPSLCTKSQSFLAKFVKGSYIIGAIMLIAMTRSRTGWLMLGATFLLVACASALRRFRAKDKAIFLILGFCVLTMVAVFTVTYFAQISVIMGKSESMSGRTDIWKAILPVLWTKPILGYGFRAFWLGLDGPSGMIALSTGYLGLANAENSVLQMWLELGAVGVGLMMVMLFVSVRNAIKCMIWASSEYVTWCSVNVFLTVLALIDGDKIMFPNTIQWILYVVSFVGLAQEARALKTHEVSISRTSSSVCQNP